MDVRCEKCQTEYELDEARLKPGGVTVKCTNCGHMFKIRKRSNTNVGAPPPGDARARTGSSKPPLANTTPRADSILGDDTVVRPALNEDPTDVRQWLIRLENGDQKSCRELATLQQWIVAGVVTRESLISRTGKTWKRLGDIVELSQYFTVADEARTTRGDRTTRPTGKPATKDGQATMLGIGASAAGGTILPDDDEEIRTTGNFKARGITAPPPVPGRTPATGVKPISAKTPPLGSSATPPAEATAAPARRPLTTPPPPPAKKTQSQSGPLPTPERPRGPSVPAGNRSTAGWATDGVGPQGGHPAGPQGPLGGKLSAIPDEPAFAGRIRVMPSDEAGFQTGKVKALDDDDDLIPGGRRGSRGGMWILLMALLVMGAAATVVYVFVIRKGKNEQAITKAPADAATVAVVPDASAPVITPVIDAPAAPVMTALEVARGELPADNETRLRDALKSLDGSTDPGALALRAHLAASIAQGLFDRATVTADKADAAKLRKDAETILLDAATAAEKAVKATPDDAAANLAMAEVLRMKAKPARDIKRYLDKAKATATGDWTREVALADALLLARETKLDDAKAAFSAIDHGDGKLESGDVRARFHLALVTYAQNKPADARPLVEQVLAAQPDHAGAKALAARLETTVAKTDPLPPEDGPKDAGAGSVKPPIPNPDVPAGGDSYDRLLARANAIAENSCGKAMELFAKALEQKPNGVEALTGMGYCHIDAKQFASAFSKFRAALAVSSKYEPALWGVAEAYQQQGRKEQAIEAFKAYLDVYPGTAKAQKQLDRLTGDSGSGTNNGSGSAPAPTPTPAPAPTPPPPSEGAGSGSG